MSDRLYYLDNCKVALTALVVMHHVALTYAATSGWYYYEPSTDKASVGILNYYMATNRAYMLAIFFFIAGYFTPGPLDRDGIGKFLKDKALRLGAPLVVFSLLIRPSIVYIMQGDVLKQKYTYWENIIAMKNVAPGPTWFLGVLLLFTLCYAVWHSFLGRSTTGGEPRRPPGLAAIVCFGAFLGLATFAARVFYPTNTQVLFLRLGNFPQYICFFMLGIVAWRRRWPLAIGSKAGTYSLVFVILLLFLLAWGMVSGGYFRGGARLFNGGVTWQSLFLSCWENFFCLAMIMGAFFMFQRFLNYRGKILKAMGRSAYGVYIIHPVIIVFVSCSLKGLALNPIAKFIVVSLIGVPLCFIVAHYLVTKIPGLSKIL